MAEHYGCPILNADSRQIYREIPIGTAAPTAEQQARVQHYFVGTKTLDENYNAGEYERDCMDLINAIQKANPQREVIAILSGGSMLYIDAVCKGLDDIPSVDETTRQTVQQLYAAGGLTALQNEVQTIDPAYWQIVDKNNPQRLMHCIEVSRSAGKPYSTFRQGKTQERPFRIIKIALERKREELYERIDRRVEQMIADGLEAEARSVWKEPLPNSLNTVGYKEMFAYFRGEISKDEAIRLIQQNSRHYAKRQMTWFRKDNELHWLKADSTDEEQIQFLDNLFN